jgi:hypothetical protein
MISVGELTIINSTTYRCLKIENDVAHLKNIIHNQGRPTKIPVNECPYMEGGTIVIPKKIPSVPKKTRSKVNITALIKENTDLQISRSAKNLLYEWVETAVGNVVSNAEQNALVRGERRITAAHIHWLETNHRVEGFWKENENYLKD